MIGCALRTLLTFLKNYRFSLKLSKHPITISFAKIKEIALLGVRRAGIFMGLGVNAALDKDFKKFDLTEITQLQFISADIDDKTISEIKEEFGYWIISCGLRELIESFAIFLDNIHLASVHMAVSKSILSVEEAKKIAPQFPRKGIKDKLPLILERFGIGPKNPNYILSISKARNCLAHRRGIIGQEDCLTTKELEVKWLGFDIFIETPSGEVHTFPIPAEGIYLKNGGIAGVKFPERTKIFMIGEQIRFLPKDLAEICNSFVFSTNEICNSFLKYGNSIGIKIEN